MDRPIGYWLKRLDQLIEQDFERVLAPQQLTRRHWQVMNTLNDGARSERDLIEALRPFSGDGDPFLTDVIRDLEGRKWIERGGPGHYCLSSLGREAHSLVSEQVLITRRRVSESVSPEDYITTVRVLMRMVDNLEHQAPNPGSSSHP